MEIKSLDIFKGDICSDNERSPNYLKQLDILIIIEHYQHLCFILDN